MELLRRAFSCDTKNAQITDKNPSYNFVCKTKYKTGGENKEQLVFLMKAFFICKLLKHDYNIFKM